MSNELILIVEDNVSHQNLMRDLLAFSGFEVKVASSAEEALIVLAKDKPRLIVMDIQLPEMNGMQLTEKLKSDDKYKDIIIIAVTAYAMKFEKDAALKAGCNDYVAKPIDTIALPLLIRKHLDANRMP